MVDRNDFKREFKKLVVETVLAHGIVVDLRASEFGWKDYDAYNHIVGKASSRARHAGEADPAPCSWAPIEETSFQEKRVYEFVDTDNGNDGIFIAVGPVSCACGELKDREIRYEGKTSNFIPLMFMDEKQFAPEW